MPPVSRHIFPCCVGPHNSNGLIIM
jgi:hypothetical protein